MRDHRSTDDGPSPAALGELARLVQQVKGWRQFHDRELAAAGLMHDAAEAYLGDVVRPLKRALPGYQEIEANMARAIGERFGLLNGYDHRIEVKEADRAALVWEMAAVRDAPWRNPPKAKAVAEAFYAEAIRLGVPQCRAACRAR